MQWRQAKMQSPVGHYEIPITVISDQTDDICDDDVLLEILWLVVGNRFVGDHGDFE